MKEKDKNIIMSVVDREGFDYAFCDYSSFPEIKDDKFHALRKTYKKRANELKEMIGYYDY